MYIENQKKNYRCLSFASILVFIGLIMMLYYIIVFTLSVRAAESAISRINLGSITNDITQQMTKVNQNLIQMRQILSDDTKALGAVLIRI